MIKTLTKVLMVGSAFATLTSTAFAEAQAPAFKFSGFTTMIAYGSDQTVKSNGRGGTDPSIAVSGADLRLTVGGKSVNNFGYKYVINFKTISDQNPIINRNYVEFDDNDVGSIQVGVVKGAEDSMPVGALNLMGGAGGIDGFISNGQVYNFSEGVILGNKIIGGTDIATKINWYSPTVEIAPGVGSLKIGLSYTPNTSHRGKGGTDNSQIGKGAYGNEDGMYPDDANAAFGLKNFIYGVTYTNTFAKDYTVTVNAIGVKEHSRLVLSGINGTSRQTYALNRTNAYQVTAMLSTKEWDFAASWLDNRKSRLPTAELSGVALKDAVYLTANGIQSYNGNSGKSWNVGTRYTFGAYQAALGYFQSKRMTDATEKATMDVITTTLDFKALEGLKFFGEVAFLRTKTNTTQVDAAKSAGDQLGLGFQSIGNNTGTVLIVGTKVSF